MNMTEQDNWGLIELKKDPLYKRLTQPQKWKILSGAMVLGNGFADKALARFSRPVDLYGIKAIIEDLGGNFEVYNRAFPSRYLAEYDKREKKITLYRANIENIAARLGANSSILRGYDLFSLCAAHELFHHLDNNRWQGSSHDIFIESTFLKIMKRKYYPVSAQEIAAHAFVQKFLALDVSPACLESLLKYA
jgi:hypothetical protein